LNKGCPYRTDSMRQALNHPEGRHWLNFGVHVKQAGLT